jgi:hypothetical protein
MIAGQCWHVCATVALALRMAVDVEARGAALELAEEGE